jgi:hypothetical protein
LIRLARRSRLGTDRDEGFRWTFSGASWIEKIKAHPRSGRFPKAFEGSIRLEVAGESFHQDALEELAGSGTEQGDRVEQLALLIPEPDNPHDPHAVGVWINRRQVGYLTRENAAVLQPAILSYHTRYGRAVACRSLIQLISESTPQA